MLLFVFFVSFKNKFLYNNNNWSIGQGIIILLMVNVSWNNNNVMMNFINKYYIICSCF